MKINYRSYPTKFYLILAGLLAASFTHAATVQSVPAVSASLTGTVFIDLAASGGGDTTRHDGAGWVELQGTLAFDIPLGQPGTITISEFGFHSGGSAANNDATAFDLEFRYLGADGVVDAVFGEGDDVSIGIVSGITHGFVGAGQYYINFGAEAVSATIDGANNVFKTYVRVNDLDPVLQESVSMKNDNAGTTKLSVAGSFEPGTASPTWAGYTIQPDGYADTMGFLNWIYVGDPLAPSEWIWAVSLTKYIYMPEGFVSPSGGWAYVPKN